MDGYTNSTYGDAFADVYDDWYHLITDVGTTVDLLADLAAEFDGLPVLDLPYIEDSTAEVDMNVVMLGKEGGDPLFVEVQGTAEGAAFSRGELDVLLELASGGVSAIMALQREMVSVPPQPRPLGR